MALFPQYRLLPLALYGPGFVSSTVHHAALVAQPVLLAGLLNGVLSPEGSHTPREVTPGVYTAPDLALLKGGVCYQSRCLSKDFEMHPAMACYQSRSLSVVLRGTLQRHMLPKSFSFYGFEMHLTEWFSF